VLLAEFSIIIASGSITAARIRRKQVDLVGFVFPLIRIGWRAHVVTAILLAITIVGIPFAWSYLKLAGLALWPIGKTIVPA
jgi:uncharacterized membrane protein YccF (DUF307 family)